MLSGSHDYHMTSRYYRYMVDKKKEEGVVYLHKEWAVYPEPYPLQTVVLDITSYAPEYREQVQTLTDLFPVDSRCFLLSSAHYGQQADVRGCGW